MEDNDVWPRSLAGPAMQRAQRTAMATPPADGLPNVHTPEIRHGETASSALGDTLRRARERCGLTLEQVSRETKITRQHLEALERGTFINVPSGFYRRAQVRIYARAVGLDPALALAQLDHLLPEVPVVNRQPESEPDARRTPKPVLWPKRTLVAIGGVLAAVALGRAMGQWEPSRRSNPDPLSVPRPLEQHADDAPEPANAVTAAPQVSREESPSTAVMESAPATPAMVSRPDSAQTRPAADLAVGVGTSPAARTSPAAGTSPAVGASPAASTSRTGSVVARADASAAPTPERPGQQAVQPSEPRAVTPAQSGLVVTTVPAGARVTVNGVAWGVTPLTIRYLPTGDKRIRVSKDGFAAQERTIRLSEGRSATVDIQLQSTR